MTDEESIARGLEAERAMKLLGPAFELVIADYLGKIVDISAAEPWEAGKISKLAMATKIAREVQGQITAIVRSGELAQEKKRRADVIADMPAEKRKWALMGGVR